MPFTVRRVGGGTFNPKAMCVSQEGESLLFIGCGTYINIYSIPDLRLKIQIRSHKAHITALAWSPECLISADADGFILFHNFNLISTIDQKPSHTIENKEPIEKIFVRTVIDPISQERVTKIFFVFYKKSMFWVSEYPESKTPSLFEVEPSVQKSICEITETQATEKNWIRFNQLDNFDIDETATHVIVGDDCKSVLYDLIKKKIVNQQNYSTPCRICKFRNELDYFVFLQDGSFRQFGQIKIKDHWHFVCPNCVCWDRTNIYSGGMEGVLLTFSQATNRHDFMPRLGMTIEGMALTQDSKYITAVIDKNMLTVIDPKSHSIFSCISNVVGDIFFNRNIITALRKPNLIQFFRSRTGECIEQLSVSTYNTRVPVTCFGLAEKYLITVETADSNINYDQNSLNFNEISEIDFDNQEKLSMALQSEFNHTKPHANLRLMSEIYRNMLTKRRYDEVVTMLKMRYGKDYQKDQSKTRNEIDFEFSDTTIEGNPLVHDTESSINVGYSEVKIWKFNEDEKSSNSNSSNFVLDQSFRIVGKKISPLIIHPRLSVFAMVVSRELQIWRNSSSTKESGKWQIWKEKRLGSVPDQLIWSPDGSILVLQFHDRLELFDIESFEPIYTKLFESSIISSSFLNDSFIIVHSKDGLALFDLRVLDVTKRIFLQASLCSSMDGCVAFVVHKTNPIVVLATNFDSINKDSDMKCWELPTKSRIRALSVSKDKHNGIAVTCIDSDNFIWMIDEKGMPEIIQPRISELTQLKRKEVQIRKKVDLIEDVTQLILESIEKHPSSLVPLDNLCDETLGFLIKRKETNQESATHIIHTEDIQEELEEVPPRPLTLPDRTSLRNLFSS